MASVETVAEKAVLQAAGSGGKRDRGGRSAEESGKGARGGRGGAANAGASAGSSAGGFAGKGVPADRKVNVVRVMQVQAQALQVVVVKVR